MPLSTPDPMLEIRDIAHSMRRIMDRVIEAAIQSKDTTGTCLYASILLANSINQFTSHRAQICGGGPPMDGGVRDPDGVIRGHYWVHVVIDGSEFVLDITSDQFGYEPVTILEGRAAHARYFPGNQDRIDRHVAEELALISSSQEQAPPVYPRP